MVILAAKPPEEHVHGLEHFFDHGIVGDANVSRTNALDGRVGLRPDHFYESILKGYDGFGADEEAREFSFSGGRRDVYDDFCDG